jgi:excisionase family DNA binding protein
MEKQAGDLGTIAPDVKMLCTVNDVAAVLSIGRTAAWELVRKRTIKSVKIGRTRRVPIAAIQEYIDRLLESEAA